MTTQNSVTVSQLQPGDVLLSYGHGWLSSAIRFIDGGRYSHAGLYDGKKVVEATKAGIASRDIEEDLKEQKFIHVYRYRGDNGEHLGSADAAELIDKANDYAKAGGKFAYHQLFLLATLAIFRRAPLPLFLKKLLRATLDDALAALNDVLQNGKQPVICSELVYRIYYEADANRYGLSIEDVIEIPKFQQLATAPATLVTGIAEEDAEAATFEQRAHEFARMYERAKAGDGQKAANPLVIADFVTPRDLETSENLEEIGPLSTDTTATRVANEVAVAGAGNAE
jgi:hypothetical protein